jgi:hypothetical protein
MMRQEGHRVAGGNQNTDWWHEFVILFGLGFHHASVAPDWAK